MQNANGVLEYQAPVGFRSAPLGGADNFTDRIGNWEVNVLPGTGIATCPLRTEQYLQ